VRTSFLVALLVLPLACVESKKPPTPFDTNWSFCRFPPGLPASVETGWVKVSVDVNEEGAAVWGSVVASSDRRFESHAFACVLRESFEPALNEAGEPVKQRVTVTLRFVR
jgi:TonB family protein